MELNPEIMRKAAELISQKDLDKELINHSVEKILAAVGEDPEREGLLRTPERVSEMYEELLAGYRIDPVKMINNALFEVDYDDMVVVKDIEYYSMCEHHMLPFIGHVHVAYLPKGKVIGLSKIPRIVDMFARRLQVQERMTKQIADFITEVLEPKGVAVMVEGLHLCAMMRGVKKHGAKMVTSAMHGYFRKNLATREEFLNIINRSNSSVSF